MFKSTMQLDGWFKTCYHYPESGFLTMMKRSSTRDLKLDFLYILRYKTWPFKIIWTKKWSNHENIFAHTKKCYSRRFRLKFSRTSSSTYSGRPAPRSPRLGLGWGHLPSEVKASKPNNIYIINLSGPTEFNSWLCRKGSRAFAKARLYFPAVFY